MHHRNRIVVLALLTAIVLTVSLMERTAWARGGRAAWRATPQGGRSAEVPRSPGDSDAVGSPAPLGQPLDTTVVLVLPAGAQLWVNGQPVEVRERRHEVTLRNLPVGKQYEYDFRVAYERDGREVHRQRAVSFFPGDNVRVDLR